IHLMGRQLVERLAGERDGSAARLDQPHDGSDDSGLPSAIGPEDVPDLPLVDFKVDPPHGLHWTIGNFQTADLQQDAHASTPRYASITSGLVWIAAALPSAIFLPKFKTTILSEID